MKKIAYIQTEFPTKFGIPRQSGLAKTQAKIIFEPKYRVPEAFRGLEAYTHIWLIWEFSEANRKDWSPSVRPPRLGGNKRMGVFATRSPFRPNPIGLSSVKLDSIEYSSQFGPVLYVSGADLMDGTPIYDIKPYLPYTDSHPDAVGGFADAVADYALTVRVPEMLMEKVPLQKRAAFLEILKNDPRPSYQKKWDRIYGFCFAGLEIRFSVCETTLTVIDIIEVGAEKHE